MITVSAISYFYFFVTFLLNLLFNADFLVFLFQKNYFPQISALGNYQVFGCESALQNYIRSGFFFPFFSFYFSSLFIPCAVIYILYSSLRHFFFFFSNDFHTPPSQFCHLTIALRVVVALPFFSIVIIILFCATRLPHQFCEFRSINKNLQH